MQEDKKDLVNQFSQELDHTHDTNQILKSLANQLNSQLDLMQKEHKKLSSQNENINHDLKCLQEDVRGVEDGQRENKQKSEELMHKWKFTDCELENKTKQLLEQQKHLQQNLQAIQKASYQLQVPTFEQQQADINIQNNLEQYNTSQ